MASEKKAPGFSEAQANLSFALWKKRAGTEEQGEICG